MITQLSLTIVSNRLWKYPDSRNCYCFAPSRENEEVGVQLRLQQEADRLHEAGQEGHLRGLYEGSEGFRA